MQEESTQLWPSITFSYFMRNDSSKAHCEEDAIIYNPYSSPKFKISLIRSYEFGHYRSFWKVNKNTFFVKASNLSMEYQNKMRQNVLIIGHLNISKKSKNTSKESKLRKLCIVEVDLFCKIAKSQLSPKLQILSNGHILFHFIWACIFSHVSYIQPWAHISFLLFNLIFHWIYSF